MSDLSRNLVIPNILASKSYSNKLPYFTDLEY
jgi:hypothetical protein